MALKYLPNGEPDYAASLPAFPAPKAADECDRICSALSRQKDGAAFAFHDQRRQFLHGQRQQQTKA